MMTLDELETRTLGKSAISHLTKFNEVKERQIFNNTIFKFPAIDEILWFVFIYYTSVVYKLIHWRYFSELLFKLGFLKLFSKQIFQEGYTKL